MKIGIVTVQDSNNFGSFLQAYALQAVLQKLGHEVVFIRSRSQKYIRRIFYVARPSKRDCMHLFQFIRLNWRGWRKYKRFQKEQQCFRVINYYKDEELDLVILGSDEIWNVQTEVFKNPIFYGADMKPVMAYAVSIGNATIGNMKCIPEDMFCQISPIYVRDKHTAEFLKTLRIDAKMVCDPTILVEKSVLYRMYQNSLLDRNPFILIYSYGLDRNVVEGIRTFARNNNLRIYSVCFSFDWCDGIIDCTALDFCAVLEKAAFVFTSTYHGTIFSILNHRQFVSMPQSRKTSDFLNALEMSDRLVSNEECNAIELQQKLINQVIDYTKIDNKINEMRITSLELLKAGLKKYEK